MDGCVGAAFRIKYVRMSGLFTRRRRVSHLRNVMVVVVVVWLLGAAGVSYSAIDKGS